MVKNLKPTPTSHSGINEKHLAIAAGTVFGLGFFSMTLLSSFTGYGYEIINILSTIYPFYKASLIGACVGFAWGFIDAFVIFYLIGWLYNYLEYNRI
jgi:hypothetical protein